jgi:catechol 2,3-dioxygenase-like lactoylglutathione lyase family enzyme
MIDHIAISVSDVAISREFYTRALAPLGYELLMDHDISGAGFGPDRKPDFWIQSGTPSGPIHIALTAQDRKTVGRFHDAAINAGGKDNGSPGLRPEYHPTYYGAFIIDPDGNNLEAVCHLPQ